MTPQMALLVPLLVFLPLPHIPFSPLFVLLIPVHSLIHLLLSLLFPPAVEIRLAPLVPYSPPNRVDYSLLVSDLTANMIQINTHHVCLTRSELRHSG